MSREWWRHVWLAFTKSWSLRPVGPRDQEIARLRAELARVERRDATSRTDDEEDC